MSRKQGLWAISGLFTLYLSTQWLRAQTQHRIVEVATLKLADGVSREQFQKVDQEMEATYMEKRSGFLSRESAPGKDGTWVAIVHWRSLADADASMKSFSSAPGTAQWMSEIAPHSLVMNRYGW